MKAFPGLYKILFVKDPRDALDRRQVFCSPAPFVATCGVDEVSAVKKTRNRPKGRRGG